MITSNGFGRTRRLRGREGGEAAELSDQSGDICRTVTLSVSVDYGGRIRRNACEHMLG